MRQVIFDNLRICNFDFPADVNITPQIILNSIQHCYNTIDMIDSNLLENDLPRLSQLVEMANLSSIVGNLLGAGLAKYSEKSYVRNKPHTYPDLLPQSPGLAGIELKTALERNKPKGHLPKAGYYITYRYVLTDSEGKYIRGKENRGDVVTIWEVKFGYLEESDFDFFNSEKDSGKTAVISAGAQNSMKLLYYDPKCSPYSTIYRGYN